MSFEYAPVTKGFMMVIGLTSLCAGVFDVKHYLHLQLIPHISKYHQYWRLLVHHVAYANSSDLFIAELFLYNLGVAVERRFGSRKFASFAVLSVLIAMTLEFLTLLAFHKFGVNIISAGPTALLFSILYQHSRLVPSNYDIRLFGVTFTDKAFSYAPAIQMALSRGRSSAAVAGIGLLTGQLYRSDMADLKRYRLPHGLAAFAGKHLLPLVGSLRPAPRSLQALPDEPSRTRTSPAASPGTTVEERDDSAEIVTTARTVAAPAVQRPSGQSVVREWVDELTGRSQTASAGFRAPAEAEIQQVTGMFPDLEREVVVAALQRSTNMEAAVQMLLSSRP